MCKQNTKPTKLYIWTLKRDSKLLNIIASFRTMENWINHNFNSGNTDNNKRGVVYVSQNFLYKGYDILSGSCNASAKQCHCIAIKYYYNKSKKFEKCRPKLKALLFVSGLSSELFYVRDGVVNTYAMNFIVPVPANITSLHFSWQALGRNPVSIIEL